MALTTLGPDTNAVIGQTPKTSTANTIADVTGLVSRSATPFVSTLLAHQENYKGAELAWVAGNSVQSASSQFLSNGQGMSLGMPNSASYYSGGGLSYGTPSFATTGTATTGTTGSTGMGNVEGILQESATSQAYLIGIQAQLGYQQTFYTGFSNALNAKFNMERSAIQNFRV